MKKLLFGIFATLITLPAMAIDVTGIITDEAGEPLIGATVIATNTTNGVASDADGNFTLKNVPANSKIRISYLGFKPQEITPQEDMGTIKLAEETTDLDEVVVSGKASSKKCTPSKAEKEVVKDIISQKCFPVECASNQYVLTNKRTAYRNGSVILFDKTHQDYDTETFTEITVGEECEDQVGKSCTATDTNAKVAKYKWDGSKLNCVIEKCNGNYLPNNNGTACDLSEGPCTDAQIKAIQHATAGQLKKGICNATECDGGYEAVDGKCIAISGDCKPMPSGAATAHREWDTTTNTEVCIIDTCKDGTTRSNDKKSCLSPKLSKEDQEKKIAELEKNAQAMKDKEQSTANKTIGAAAIGATGIGAMNALSAMSEKQADENAEEAMKAYLATFRCNYGNSMTIQGGEREIILPGGNELAPLYTEYQNLAADLKIRKDALGLRPGIESEVILDKATTGLYDDVGVGITSGAYTSLARALQNPDGEDAKKWQEQKDASAKKLKTGLITAGAGIAVGAVGNLIANAKAPKESSAEINSRYEKMKKIFDNTQPAINKLPEVPQDTTCPTGATGSYPNCNCGSKAIYAAGENRCDACPGDKVAKDNQCACPGDTKPTANDKCEAMPGIIPQCDTTDPNISVNKTTGMCSCINGYQLVGKNCTCPANTHEVNANGTCMPVISPKLTPAKIVLPAKNTFAHNSSTLSNEATQIVKGFATQVKDAAGDSTNYCITVVGHTDKTGSDKVNQPLSQKRADAVKTVLTQNGIPDANIKTSGRASLDCTLNGKQESCRTVEISYSSETCNGGGSAAETVVEQALQKITGTGTSADTVKTTDATSDAQSIGSLAEKIAGQTVPSWATVIAQRHPSTIPTSLSTDATVKAQAFFNKCTSDNGFVTVEAAGNFLAPTSDFYCFLERGYESDADVANSAQQDKLITDYEATHGGRYPSQSYYDANIRPLEKQNKAQQAIESYCKTMVDGATYNTLTLGGDTHKYYHCIIHLT